MREMLENKVILAFIFIMLGIVCINIPSTQLNNEDLNQQTNSYEEYVVYNK